MISKELFSLEDSAMLVSSGTSFSSADGSKYRVASILWKLNACLLLLAVCRTYFYFIM